MVSSNDSNCGCDHCQDPDRVGVTRDAVSFDRLSNVTVHISPFEILTESGDCGHGLFEILSTVS